MREQNPLDAQLTATHDMFIDERPPGANEDVHMLASTVDHVIERCTKPGDVVLDPFAGFGTTLARAVALGRRAVGIELLPERVDHLRRRIPSAHVLEGDARRLLGRLPEASIDAVLTSPPDMTESHHDEDPLTAYEELGGDYTRYLSELAGVAAQWARIVKPGGFVVCNVADIHHMGHTTHLIADCAQAMRQHLAHVGTTEIAWDHLPHDLVADALLVLRRP